MIKEKIAAGRAVLKLSEQSSRNGQFAYLRFMWEQCPLTLIWYENGCRDEWDRIVQVVARRYHLSEDDVWDAVHWLEEYQEPMTAVERKEAFNEYWYHSDV